MHAVWVLTIDFYHQQRSCQFAQRSDHEECGVPTPDLGQPEDIKALKGGRGFDVRTGTSGVQPTCSLSLSFTLFENMLKGLKFWWFIATHYHCSVFDEKTAASAFARGLGDALSHFA